VSVPLVVLLVLVLLVLVLVVVLLLMLSNRLQYLHVPRFACITYQNIDNFYIRNMC
jgi:hypothetical protein